MFGPECILYLRAGRLWRTQDCRPQRRTVGKFSRARLDDSIHEKRVPRSVRGAREVEPMAISRRAALGRAATILAAAPMAGMMRPQAAAPATENFGALPSKQQLWEDMLF